MANVQEAPFRVANRWTALKALGTGGQGTVWEASRIDPAHAEQALTSVLTESWRLQGWGKEQREAYTRRFVDAIEALSNRYSPANVGALKVIHPIADRKGREQASERLKREHEALTKVPHDNIVRLLDADDDGQWLVMELLPGRSLEADLQRTRGSGLASLRRIRPLVAAVAHLHEAEVVHRDIKPANILLREDGDLVLGDMGIVWFADAEHTRCTTTLESVGSRHWMPPWAEGARLDSVLPTFDVYSLGKVLWSLASGKPRLKREWWTRPDHDLTLLHPHDAGMHLVNEILSESVVEDEPKVLPNASKMLDRIDDALSQLESGILIRNHRIDGPCRCCGLGRYELLAREDGPELNNWGLSPRGTMRLRVFECTRCGHVEMFGTQSRSGGPREAWAR